MLKTKREQQILDILKTNGTFIDVKTLCQTLYASQSSIRRDLKRMESAGLIERSYGGAKLNQSFSTVINYNERFNSNAYEKTVIAKKAVKLIGDNSIIFLDQSTTAVFLAKELPNKSTLTVITNNVEVLRVLSSTSITVFSSGGSLSKNNRNCLIGKDAERIFSDTYADFCFFSCKALSSDGFVSDCTREEVLLREVMLSNAKKKVFLCDSTKFNSRSAFNQCSLKDVDVLVTDDDVPPDFSAVAPNLTVLK